MSAFFFSFLKRVRRCRRLMYGWGLAPDPSRASTGGQERFRGAAILVAAASLVAIAVGRNRPDRCRVKFMIS